MISNYSATTVLFVFPLVVVVGFILSIRFISNKFIRRVVCSVLLLIFLPLLMIWIVEAPYLYALYLESNWSKVNPTSRAGLEKYLHLYSTREISPSESNWGRDYKLGEGERMVQYLILWKEPLDVVYDKDENIMVIYTSYE